MCENGDGKECGPEMEKVGVIVIHGDDCREVECYL